MSRWALLLLVAATTGCATECPTGSPCYGRPIEHEQVIRIEAGVTTAQDVAQSLGEPADLSIAEDGSETWVYRYRSPMYRSDRRGKPCAGFLTSLVSAYFYCLGDFFRLGTPPINPDERSRYGCIASQTEAELRVDFDPRAIVRAQTFASWEVPTRSVAPLPEEPDGGS